MDAEFDNDLKIDELRALSASEKALILSKASGMSQIPLSMENIYYPINTLSFFNLVVTSPSSNQTKNQCYLDDSIMNEYLALLTLETEFGFLDSFKLQQRVAKKMRIEHKLFEKKMIFFPICEDNHWSLLTITPFVKNIIVSVNITLYDSLNLGFPREMIQKVFRVLETEARDDQFLFDSENGTREMYQKTPRQTNSYDCGVFCLVAAYFIVKNSDLIFEQKNIPFFRHKIAIEILNGDIWPMQAKTSENNTSNSLKGFILMFF